VEKDRYSITLTIKHETAVYLLFLAGGVLAVYFAFILQPRGPELWPSINAAGITSAVYLLLVLIYTLRRPVSRFVRILVAVSAAIGIAAIATAWTTMDMQSHWQRERLLEIRTVIGRGISYAFDSDSLLTVLERYHARGGHNLPAAFHSVFPRAVVGSNLHRPQWETDTARVVLVTELTPTSVTLVSVDKVARGRSAGFVNIGGLTGKTQERYTLTEKGLQHVTDN
jgi:hypothetical protein